MLVFDQNDDIAEVSGFEIDAFERNQGISIPTDYRSFLQVVKGGTPSNNWVPLQGDGDYISLFFGLRAEVSWKALDYGIEHLGAPGETGYLPIAVSSGGNYFLLKVQDPDLGAVFFWDHEAEDSQPPTFTRLTRVASTFDRFTAKLQSPPNTG